MSRYNIFLSILFTIAFLPLESALTQEANLKKQSSNPKTTNAALYYWQAFALLPPLDAEQQKLVSQSINAGTLAKEFDGILDRCENSFELARLATKKMDCNWGILQKGPMTNLPHLGRANMLAKLLVLNAKRSISKNLSEKAVQDIQSALLLGRNIDDGPIVCFLVGQSIKRTVVDGLTPHREKLDAGFSKNLLAAIDSLPKSTSLQDSIAAEGKMLIGWLDKALQDDEPSKRKVFKGILKINGVDTGKRNKEEFRKKAKSDIPELKKLIDKLVELSGRPSSETEKMAEQWNQSIKNTDNILALFLPDSKLLSKAKKSQQKWENFRSMILQRSTN